MVLRLIRLSRLNHLQKCSLLAYYSTPSKKIVYVIIRIANGFIYVDVAFVTSSRSNLVIRYKVIGRPFAYLYRKARCQNALKNLIVKYASP